jgi:manganese efflux pump family protein
LSAIDLAFIALVISADNFAAALALGALGQGRRAWRISLAFGAFGGAAPLLGMLLGRQVSGYLRDYADWAGVAVLVALGLWTIGQARDGIDRRAARRAGRGGGLLLLAAGVSADNLAVGLGLGLHGVESWTLGAATGVSTVLVSLLGLRLGDGVRRAWQQRAALGAGLLLLMLAGAVALGWI